MARALDREADRGAPGVAVPPVAVPPMPAAAPTGKTEASPPRFDIVRVEPKGDTVVAGNAAPNAKVALLASGKVIAEGKADATGQFVLLPPPLAPGAYDLTLRQTPDAAKPGAAASVESAQSVAVSVPKNGGQVAVALAEPGRPSKILSAPAPSVMPGVAPSVMPGVAPSVMPGVAPSVMPGVAAAAKTAMPQGLGVRSVELENGNGFFASGSAAPGTPVHVYLNDTHLADVVAGADGAWSVTIRKGLAGGHYTVRADAGPGTSVAARVEVPFDVPAGMADAAIVSPGDGRAPGLAGLATPRTETENPQARASADRAKSTPTTSMAAATPSDAAGSAAASDTATASSAHTADAAPGQSTAVIEEVRTRQVLGGDNLWKISRERFGFGRRFTQIYAANATQIHDPALIYPGQVFVLPAK